MSGYGLFSEARPLPDADTFLALQVALSSYPGDPLRDGLLHSADRIAAETGREAQIEIVERAMSGMASVATPWVEYCCWDYSLISSVANREFSSWVDPIQRLAFAGEDGEDVSAFSPDDTSYIVVTLVILAVGGPLKRWLEWYPKSLPEKDLFRRRTIKALYGGCATGHLFATSVNAMLTVMPKKKELFYLGSHLRGTEWNYLRPVF